MWGSRSGYVVTPASPMAGSAFELDASSSTGPSPLVEYAWDLDGNGSFESASPSPITHYVFAAAGPHSISLRVTDDQARTAQVTRVITVGGDPNQVTITVVRAGNTAGAYVISNPSRISCSGSPSDTCSASFPRGSLVRLDAYVEGVPAQGAWGNIQGADGYQLFLSNVQADRTVTATF